MSFEHIVPYVFDKRRFAYSNGMACFSWLKSADSDLGQLLVRLLKHYAPSAIAPDRTNLSQHVSREFIGYNISLVFGTHVRQNILECVFVKLAQPLQFFRVRLDQIVRTDIQVY